MSVRERLLRLEAKFWEAAGTVDPRPTSAAATLIGDRPGEGGM